MDQAQLRDIRDQCSALSMAYARSVDFRDYDSFAELFTEDGELELERPIRGRTAIAAAIRTRPDQRRSRHVISNVFIDVLSATEARGIAYLTLYRHDGEESLSPGPVPLDGPFAIGHYEDRFAKTDAGWKFKRRRLHLAFQR